MSNSGQFTCGNILRELRTYHDYKQKDISSYLNITSQAYSNYERNQRTPDIEVMYKIAEFYNITLDQLVRYCYLGTIEESCNYNAPKKVYRAVHDSSVSIPITGKQAQILKDILSLTEEQQDACHQFINFLKLPVS